MINEDNDNNVIREEQAIWDTTTFQVDSRANLGINFKSSLSLDIHITHIVIEAFRNLGFVMRCDILDIDVKVRIPWSIWSPGTYVEKSVENWNKTMQMFSLSEL